MSEVHDQAVHLLAIPQLGTYLTPEGREMVLRALEEEGSELRKQQDEYTRLDREWGEDFDKMKARAEAAEAQLAMVRAALNGMAASIPDSPAPAEAKEGSELAPPAAAPSPTPEQVAGDVPEGSAAPSGESREAATPTVGTGEARAVETASDSPAAAIDCACGKFAIDSRKGFVLDFGGQKHSREGCFARAQEESPMRLPCAKCGKPTRQGKCPENEPEKWGEWAGLTLCAACTEEVRNAKTCAGHNKSAKTICGSTAVAVQRGGKWYCKRHDPEKSKVCLVPGCGEPGRTAKGSPGIWCKEHAKKLSAAERGSIAERVKRLEAA